MYRRFLARSASFLLLSVLVSSCLRDLIEVKYNLMVSPAEPYADLSRLAVGLDPKLDTKLQQSLLEGLKACPLYKNISTMDKPVRVSGPNAKDYLDALVKRSPTAQEAQGILSLQIEDYTESSSLDKAQSFVLADSAKSDWYPSFGIPVVGTLGFPRRPEIAPKWTVRKRNTYIRAEKIQYILRFVLYNKSSGKIVHDRIVTNNSTLLNYSRRPTLKKPRFLELIQKSVLDEVLFYTCPIKEEVTRKLYYSKTGDEKSDLINEGVDLAEEGRWSLAEAKWSNVLKTDSKNLIANHNLGVAAEKAGEVFKAMNYFKISRFGVIDEKPLGNIFDEIKTKYQPRIEGEPLYPQVSFVTGGNWVFIRSDDMELTTGGTYSLYRMDPEVNSENSRLVGLNLREVGLFRVMAPSELYYPGRIREFLIDYPIKPGDFVIAE